VFHNGHVRPYIFKGK